MPVMIGTCLVHLTVHAALGSRLAQSMTSVCKPRNTPSQVGAGLATLKRRNWEVVLAGVRRTGVVRILCAIYL